jgi:hypothetical protein
MTSQPREDRSSFGFLRCAGCGKRTHCTEAEIIKYAKLDSWPLCCGQIMLFFAGDQATDEMPALHIRAG